MGRTADEGEVMDGIGQGVPLQLLGAGLPVLVALVGVYWALTKRRGG